MGMNYYTGDGEHIGKRSCAAIGACMPYMFSWAMEREDVKDLCNRFSNAPLVKDEYGFEVTGKEFWDMVENKCMQIFTGVGTTFC